MFPLRRVTPRPDPVQPAPAPLQRRPAAAVAAPMGVQPSTEVQPHSYTPAEQAWQEASRATLRRVAQDLQANLAPTPYDRLQLINLLRYRSAAPLDREAFAADVLRVLATYRFGIHSARENVIAEHHVRLLYAASATLAATATRYAFQWQRELVGQLSHLQQYVREQDNPATLYYLACLRNSIVALRDDESTLATLLRYGIPLGVGAAAALGQHPGVAGAAALGAAEQVMLARLRPDNWWEKLQQLEKLSQSIHWDVFDDAAPTQACNALLRFTDETLSQEIPRLAAWPSDVKRRLKDAFNRAKLRPVDNEWDLAFGCLEKLHEHAAHFTTTKQIGALLKQLHLVLRANKTQALHFKVLEILRDLRREPSLRAICKILLHLGGKDAPTLVQAVADKRTTEAQLLASIINHPGGDFHGAERQAAPHLRMLTLSRRATLRLHRASSVPPLPASAGALAAPARLLLQAPGAPPVPAPNSGLANATAIDGRSLRLALSPGEGLPLVRDAIERGDTDELEALLLAGVHVADEAPEPGARVGNKPRSMLALACHLGRREVVRTLATALGERRGFLGASARREAGATPPQAGVQAVTDTLQRRLRELPQPRNP